MDKSKKSYSRKAQRPHVQTTQKVTGDAISYFILHNMISVFFFFLFTINLEVYDAREITITFLFTLDFWEMVIFEVFIFSMLSSGIGRVGAYLIIKGGYYLRNRKRRKKKITKRWGELNSGINQFHWLVFILTALITSLIYSLGVVFILRDTIFSSDSLSSLIVIYIGFKVGVYFFIRWLTKAKT